MNAALAEIATLEGTKFMKPIIGITSRDDYTGRIKINLVNHTYIDAVIEAGGIPLVLANLQDLDDIDGYIKTLDGIIFSGGEDISPLVYGENPIKEVKNISYRRDKFELELFNRSYEKGLPILGICRGIQLVNVALGGSLYQDIHQQIPQALGHVSTYRIEGGYHTIDIERDSILFDIFKEKKIQVNSQHHQRVKDVGDKLRVCARAHDGVIEAIESSNDNFVLGVQFHPAAMVSEHEEFVSIFEYFINRCT